MQLISSRYMVLSLAFTMGVGACADAPADGAEDTQETSVLTLSARDRAALDSGAALLGVAGAPVRSSTTASPSGVETNVVFNSCDACLDPSQLCDCRSGSCFTWRAQGTDKLLCYAGSIFLYQFTCPHWVRVRC